MTAQHRARILTRGHAKVADLQEALDSLGVEPGEHFVVIAQKTLLKPMPETDENGAIVLDYDAGGDDGSPTRKPMAT